MPASLNERYGQIGRTKSKTGCDTCKIRRVRCGEEKPHCLRCTSTGRQCSYKRKTSESLNAVARSVGHSPAPLTSPFWIGVEPQAGWRERRAFEFYFHQASPSLSGAVDLFFWRGCVLQTCRMEPAIWDAIISLSSLYERPPLHESPPFWLVKGPAAVQYQSHREALVWYSRSLSVLQQHINEGTADLSVSLISCILFITIELLQGNRKSALTLYKQGAQLMSSADCGILTTTIKPIFRRLGTWIFISDGVLYNGWDLNPAPPSGRFASIDEARNVLCGIVAEMKTMNMAAKSHWKQTAEIREQEAPALKARQEHLEGRLRHWHQLFMSLETSDSREVIGSDDSVTALLLMTYMGVLIEVQTSLKPDQAAYDAYELEFNQILGYASTVITSTRDSDGKQPPFMFETGVFLPLLITALKCRYPQLRRQALRLMWEAPPAQGMFMCGPAAHVAAVVVALEENPRLQIDKPPDASDLLFKPGCIPASKDRVWDFSISSDVNHDRQTENWLHYSLRDFDDEEGRIQFTHRSVLFPRIKSSLD